MLLTLLKDKDAVHIGLCFVRENCNFLLSFVFARWFEPQREKDEEVAKYSLTDRFWRLVAVAMNAIKEHKTQNSDKFTRANLSKAAFHALFIANEAKTVHNALKLHVLI